MKLILLGAPGAGKGTQGETIAKVLGVPLISTGNIIREAIRNKTPIGIKAKAMVDSGSLVDDATVIGIVRERLTMPDCENGYILDGFPRTIPQAKALDEMGILIDRVVNIDVPDEVIVKRLSERRVCTGCGSPYHLTSKEPKCSGVCDCCGDKLIQRVDDAAETVLERLDIYHKQTEPLIGYYTEQDKICTIDGQLSVEQATKTTLDALGINL